MKHIVLLCIALSLSCSSGSEPPPALSSAEPAPAPTSTQATPPVETDSPPAIVTALQVETTGKCDPATNAFCVCRQDSDCIRQSEPLMAGICGSPLGDTRHCQNKFAPWRAEIRGEIAGFCRAYVNGCRNASIEIEGTRISIAGPAADPDDGACAITAEGESGGGTVGSLWRIGDSQVACTHNIALYFYTFAEAAKEGRFRCCGFDWKYKPTR